VRVCDECNYGSYAGRCVICGGVGISDAYYCKECTMQEKDVRCLSACVCFACAARSPNAVCSCACAAAQRDGCPKIVNLGSAKTDLFYERKKCACGAACAPVLNVRRAFAHALTWRFCCLLVVYDLALRSTRRVQKEIGSAGSAARTVARADARGLAGSGCSSLLTVEASCTAAGGVGGEPRDTITEPTQ
jgi:hypothetical protein